MDHSIEVDHNLQVERDLLEVPNDHGLLLVGHGTRDAHGLEEFHQTVTQVSRLWKWGPVEGGFLELASPTVSDGIDRLASRGVRRLRVVPLLLFAAGHAKRDIPQTVETAVARYPEIVVSQASILGCHPSIVALSRQRYREAVAARDPVPERQTVLLLVGRGSHDQEATSEMVRFARLRTQGEKFAKVAVSFLAMAEPSFSETISRLARLDHSRLDYYRIVVQPHLLFHGDLADDVATQVAALAASHPALEWIATGHLGPAQGLAQAIYQRATSVVNAVR